MPREFTKRVFTSELPEFLSFALAWVEEQDWADKSDDAAFQFIRALKGHQVLKRCSAAEAHRQVVAVARRYGMQLDLPDLDLVEEEGEVAFHALWERVRFPMDTDLVESACTLAGRGMLRTQTERPGRYARFLTIAALLQLQVGQKPIFLPTRKLAHHFPAEPNSICAWTRWARADQVLVLTQRHEFHPGGGSRAAEYVFGLHLWPDVLPKLAALLNLPLRDADVAWIRGQFSVRADPLGGRPPCHSQA